MKKLALILASIMMAASLAACGGTTEPEATVEPTEEVSKYVSLLKDATEATAGVTLEENQVAVTKVLAAGVDGENIEVNSVDGNMETRWTGAYGPSWIMFDLGEEVTVTSVDIAMWYGQERQYPFTMEVSNDGENWTAVTEELANSVTTEDFEKYEIATPTAGRYIRYNGKGSTTEGKNYCHINEIKFYK